jgi:hypothetical protein
MAVAENESIAKTRFKLIEVGGFLLTLV